MQQQHLPALTILRLKQVGIETGLSRSSIYRGIQAGTFPNSIPLGPRAVGWRRGDIDAWLANPAGYRAQAAV
ncbi:helix-turn-helix transcriptional regulator [Massilia consociata]|uniref:Helix-turn-helix transcriptional regulator n=2 Tax=Massilia consociata TaxID=760117 RepID=A0ABV6FH90_9BURK